MTTEALGRLERVSLRKVWGSESEDFTPWLAEPENLQELAKAIGLELEFESREKDVGPFRADILCKDTLTDQWVLIENQLEKTDHSHLGQLLTYAAGLQAVTIIWVAQQFTEEHRAALDWLNEHTDEKINFFGLEVELWQIGASPVAPKFNIVCKPNAWSRTVQQAAQGGLSETQQLRLEFWETFTAYMKGKSKITCQKPLAQSWMNHPLGRSGIKLASVASTWNTASNGYAVPELRVEFVLETANSKEMYRKVEAQREEIEKQLGVQLTWHNPENARLCRIWTRIDEDFRDRTRWPQQHEWLRTNLENFQRVFGPIVKTL